MNVQILKKDDVPEYAVLPYADYEALLDAAEMASDVSAYRNAKRALAVGEDESIPYAMVEKILLHGANPVAEWRRHRGLTQVALAERAGVTQAAIASIERGKRKPSVELLMKLADALGVTMDDLVTVAD